MNTASVKTLIDESISYRSATSKPFRRGRLLIFSTGSAVLDFSSLDENLSWRGATPTLSFWAQVRLGPCDWRMFVSCIGFLLPAAVHAYNREHVFDYFVSFALLCISISSPLCDCICVHSAIYDSGGPDADYVETAIATGKTPIEVQKRIRESGGDVDVIHVMANDIWNNLTRGIDRTICSLLGAPAMLLYCLKQRPGVTNTLVFLAGFALAWSFAVAGMIVRKRNPCAVRVGNGLDEPKFVMDRDYKLYQYLHETWHFLLIILFTASAFFRPSHS